MGSSVGWGAGGRRERLREAALARSAEGEVCCVVGDWWEGVGEWSVGVFGSFLREGRFDSWMEKGVEFMEAATAATVWGEACWGGFTAESRRRGSAMLCWWWVVKMGGCEIEAMCSSHYVRVGSASILLYRRMKTSFPKRFDSYRSCMHVGL